MSFTLRPYRPADAAAVAALMALAYRDLGGAYASEPELSLLHRIYPEGQWLAEAEGELLGVVLNRWVPWSEFSIPHPQSKVLDTSRYEADHLAGDAVYCLDIVCHPRGRRLGVAAALDEVVHRQSDIAGARFHFGVARLAGVAALPEGSDLQRYVADVYAGRRQDPVSSFHVRRGYQPIAVIPDFNADDLPCRGAGALVFRPLPGRPLPQTLRYAG